MNKYTILMGMTNSGKDTIQKYICEHTDYTPIISYTSRPIRANETNHIEYHFVDTREMIDMIDNNEFIEYRTYNTLVDNIPSIWYYGVKKENHIGNKIVILDVQGAKDFINYYGSENCSVFYLDVPTRVLKQRCIDRGDYNKYEFNRRIDSDMRVFNYDDLNELNVIRIENDSVENMCKKIIEYV